MTYGTTKETSLNFQEAISKVKEELKKEGFGILTEIDVKKTLKEKLNLNYNDYVILGACNPQLAYKALQAEKEIGLLLPCNVIVYEDKGETYVSVINPIEAMSIVDNKSLESIAQQVQEKLKKVLDNL